MIHNIINTPAPRNCGNKYVISSCMYTFQGYSLFLKEQGVNVSSILFEGERISQNCVEELILDNSAEITVFLPKNDVLLLDTLKKTALLLNTLPAARSVMLCGEIPFFWLYCTLEKLVNDKNKLSKITGASIADFGIYLKGKKMGVKNNYLKLSSKSSDLICNSNHKGLTKREIEILLYHLRGVDVSKQSNIIGLSRKTIYSHRKKALLKFQTVSHMKNNASGVKKDCEMLGERCAFSEHESLIYNALIKREIFPVFQAITNSSMEVVGFEVLLRWNKSGKIIKPIHFLNDINDVNIWLKITVLVIYAAVSGINKYNGRFYYSVNIPHQLASRSALPQMAKKAIEMLLKPQWANRLVFEFAETIDVTKNPDIPKTMMQLRSTGSRLFLDDCFSNHQVMFPVRQVRFDGFKLDKDIIDQFLTNDSDYHLIKAIQFYSDMTGSDCVAEGVDSREKFDKLVTLGINSFQGNYIAEAVKEEELDSIVRKFIK